MLAVLIYIYIGNNFSNALEELVELEGFNRGETDNIVANFFYNPVVKFFGVVLVLFFCFMILLEAIIIVHFRNYSINF